MRTRPRGDLSVHQDCLGKPQSVRVLGWGFHHGCLYEKSEALREQRVGAKQGNQQRVCGPQHGSAPGPHRRGAGAADRGLCPQLHVLRLAKAAVCLGRPTFGCFECPVPAHFPLSLGVSGHCLVLLHYLSRGWPF